VEKATYDISGWPVLLVTMSPAPMNSAEFERYLEKLGSYFQRGRLGLVIDVRNAGGLTASQRRSIANWLDRIVERYPERLACMGIVMSSAAQRGIFKAISWLIKAPFERAAFSELEPAKKWAYASARVSVGQRAAAP
jgi:hypothetical protein